jgi:hypothetical protein
LGLTTGGIPDDAITVYDEEVDYDRTVILYKETVMDEWKELWNGMSLMWFEVLTVLLVEDYRN